jgi:MscS family membrane protein
MSRKWIFGVWAVVFVGLGAVGPVRAQFEALTGDSEDAAPPAEAEVDPDQAARLANPRSTMSSFLQSMNDGDTSAAAECLDLGHLDQPTAEERGPSYAFRLKETLDRMARIDVELFPDDPQRDKPFVVGSTLTDALSGADLDDANRIVIARGGDGLWRFNQETVGRIKGLYDRWRDRPEVEGLTKGRSARTWDVWLEEQFPASLRRRRFLLPDYQWICLVAVIFLGFVSDLVVRSLLHYLSRAWFRFVKSTEQVPVERKLWRPAGLLAQALVWYFGTRIIGLDLALQILLPALKLFAVVAGGWTAFMFVNLLSTYLVAKAAKTGTKFDDLLIPLLTKSLKATVVVIGVLIFAEAFGLPILGLLGGLGIVGAALALASKDAVSNFFGSVTVLVDRPFEIGDWVITNDVEGTVETVGFRSTRIRTFYNSLITLPNCLLTTAIVDNMGRRRYRRIKTMISIQYDTTPARIDAFCEGVREIIRRHPYTRKDYFHVYLNQFSASSIDVLLYCFVEVPDWSVELRERHRLFVDIMRLAEQLGVQFAFPTRTLHLLTEERPDGGPPSDLTDPLAVGRRQAAQVAGPLLTGAARPGPVQFVGPTPVESDEPDDAAGDHGGVDE